MDLSNVATLKKGLPSSNITTTVTPKTPRELLMEANFREIESLSNGRKLDPVRSVELKIEIGASVVSAKDIGLATVDFHQSIEEVEDIHAPHQEEAATEEEEEEEAVAAEEEEEETVIIRRIEGGIRHHDARVRDHREDFLVSRDHPRDFRLDRLRALLRSGELVAILSRVLALRNAMLEDVRPLHSDDPIQSHSLRMEL